MKNKYLHSEKQRVPALPKARAFAGLVAVVLAGCLSILGGPASAATPVKLADFETSIPATVIADKNCTITATSQAPGALDQTTALRFTVTLLGEHAGWAGVRIPLTSQTLTRDIDTFEIHARAEEKSRALFITLTEADGARWNTSIPTGSAWKHYQVPLYQFRWLEGPQSRKSTRPNLADLRSVELWIGNTFQGPNGFSVDNLALADRVPDFELALTTSTLHEQKPTTLTLEARDKSGQRAPFTGPVWLEIADRADAILPRSVKLQNGKGDFEIFPRRAGKLELHAYEPNTGQDKKLTLDITPADVHVDFRVPGFQGEQVLYAVERLAPKLEITGDAVPLTAHIEVRDHKQKRLFSSFMRVADLHGNKESLMIPETGLHEVRVRVLADPLAQLPHVEDNATIPLRDVPTTATAKLPDGVTTTTLLDFQVTLEDLPSTATVIGEDRLPLLCLAETPKEIFFNRWMFGISDPPLMNLDANYLPTTGELMLKWHRKLGAGWGRNDLFWEQIQPDKNAWGWQKISNIISSFRQNRIKPLGILDYAAAWRNGKAPATDEERSEWIEFVRRVTDNFKETLYGIEVWNEPNHGFWKPSPDANAYRELVKATWTGARMRNDQQTSSARIYIVAGATAGFDPVFLHKLAKDGYDKYWDVLSFHPYPQALNASPEENAFAEILEEGRDVLRFNNIQKELWLTEMGWPSGPGGVSELDQANYLVRAYTLALYHRYNKLFWFTLNDWTPWWDNADMGAHMGLFDSNFHPKPAASAYNIATYILASITPREQTRQGKADIYSFLVERQSTRFESFLHVAWTPNKGDEQDIELPMKMGAVYCFDYLGSEQKPQLLKVETADATSSGSLSTDDAPTTKTYRFHVTDEPLYIWDAWKPRPRKPQN